MEKKDHGCVVTTWHIKEKFVLENRIPEHPPSSVDCVIVQKGRLMKEIVSLIEIKPTFRYNL